MVSSGRQAIVSLLLLVSTVVGAHAQSAVDKNVSSTISGKVTVGGKGAQGVVVGLVLVDQGFANRSATRFKATTDEEGNYRIANVRPGRYEVVTSATAYVSSDGPKSLFVGKNEVIENIDITLLRGGVITGKVTDADGRPVIEEWVYLAAVSQRERVLYPRSIRTDDRGIYRAFGIPAGRYTVAIGRDSRTSYEASSRGGYQRTYHPSAVDPAQATAIEVSEGSEATDVDITLGRPERRYSARGRIIDTDTSRPMPGLRVSVQVFFQNGSSSSTAAQSNKDGEFLVENLVPGKYAVFVERPPDSDLISEPVRFEVIDQDIDGLLLKSSIGGSISGVVVVEGTNDPKVRANLAGARIVGRFEDSVAEAVRYPSASIQADGSFRLTGLRAGRLTLQVQTRELVRLARVERGGIPYPRGIEIRDREQVTGLRVVISHANGTIRGVVKIPEGLVLPPGTRLLIGARRTEDGNPGSYGPPIEVDARGQFIVKGLTPGTYEIVVLVLANLPLDQRPRIPRTSQIVVVANDAVADVTMTLEMLRPAPSRP